MSGSTQWDDTTGYTTWDDLGTTWDPYPGMPQLWLGQLICGFSPDDFAQVLADLLPRGWVWPRDPEAVQQLVMRGLAEEIWRVAARDCDLLNEAYPCGSTETLTDWERLCGLPDECAGPLTTLQERRLAVCGKLATVGGQSAQYFIDLAKSYGVDIEIETFPAFRASEGRCGEPLNDEGWLYTWRVTVHQQTQVVYFRAGQSTAGEPLASWGSRLIECVLREACPAHTVLIFRYVTTAVWDHGASIWDDGASIWDQTI